MNTYIFCVINEVYTVFFGNGSVFDSRCLICIIKVIQIYTRPSHRQARVPHSVR